MNKPNTKADLNRWGFSNQVLNVENRSQKIYDGKGNLLVITLPEGQVVLKQQKTKDVEVANLDWKKAAFPNNYPQVYSHGDGFLILEHIDGICAWDQILAENNDIPLEQMVSHLAEIHNLSQRQLASGKIDFKPKNYADYCRFRFNKHLGGIICFDFDEAHKDLIEVVNPILSAYHHVEHVDANLSNWIGLVKIDETNNTTTVPHMTLKSMLEYGPLQLDNHRLNALYQAYCLATSQDFEKFMKLNPYTNIVFHLNKFFRTLRYLEKMGTTEDGNTLIALKRHIGIVNDSLNVLHSNHCYLPGLSKFKATIIKYCKERDFL